MAFNVITKIFGTKHDRDVKKLMPMVDEIKSYEAELEKLSEDELKAKTPEFRKRLEDGETVDDLLPEAFATLKEACKRLMGTKYEVVGISQSWDMIPYDVQLVGGIVLQQGKIAQKPSVSAARNCR